MPPASRIPAAEWDQQKETIRRLYQDDGRELADVMEHMEKHHGFRPTKAQYVRKLGNWGFAKYCSGKTWNKVSEQLQKRELDGKDSHQVTIHGKPISSKRLKKSLGHHVPLVKLSPNSPVSQSDAFIVNTPSTNVTGFVLPPHMPWLKFEKTVLQTRKFVDHTKGYSMHEKTKLICVVVDRFSNTPTQEDAWVARDGRASVTNGNLTMAHGSLHGAQDPQKNMKSFLQVINGRTWDGSRSTDPHGTRLTRDLNSLQQGILSDNIVTASSSGQVGAAASLISPLFSALRYSVYLVSNNLMGHHQRRNLLEWAINSNVFWAVKSVIKEKSESAESFAMGMLCPAIDLDNVGVFDELLSFASSTRLPCCNEHGASTALTKAAFFGSEATLKFLLRRGAPMEQNDGTNSLCMAVRWRHFRVVSVLSAEVSLNGWCTLTALALHYTESLKYASQSAGVLLSKLASPLQLALHQGDIVMVKILLEAGADANFPAMERRRSQIFYGEGARGLDFRVPIDVALWSTPPQASRSSPLAVSYLLDYGADPTLLPPKSFEKYFIGTCNQARTADAMAMMELAPRLGVDAARLECVDGSSCLGEACRTSSVQLVEALIALGANVNSCSDAGCISQYPLTVALRKHYLENRMEIVNVLISAGADVNWTTLRAAAGLNDFSVAEIVFNMVVPVGQPLDWRYDFNTLLRDASGTGNAALVERLLGAGVHPNLPAHGKLVCSRRSRSYHRRKFLESTHSLPLQAALEGGHDEIVKALLNAGADPNLHPGCGCTSLRLGMRHAITGDATLFRLLLQHGASPNEPCHFDDGPCRGFQYDRELLSPLANACAFYECFEIAQTLLEYGATVNPDESYPGPAPLQMAVKWQGSDNETDFIQMLLDAGAKVNALRERCSYSAASAFDNALEYRNLYAAEMLLRAGAEPGSRSMLEWIQLCLKVAVKETDTEKTLLMLSKGADPNGYIIRCYDCTVDMPCDECSMPFYYWFFDFIDFEKMPTDMNVKFEFPLLVVAGMNGNLDIAKYLLDAGADAGADARASPATCERDLLGSGTALQIAVADGKTEFAEMLLGAGADIDAVDRLSGGLGTYTPLQIAVKQNNEGLVALLLAHNADVNAPAEPEYGATALQYASMKGNIAMAVALLEHGADVNAPAATKFTATALQYASMKGNIAMAVALLEHGADVNAPAEPEYGATALQYASRNGDIAMVVALLEHGADVNAPAEPEYGATALQYASSNGDIAMAVALLEHGADANAPAKTDYGATALQYASINGDIAMAVSLLEHGADVDALGAARGGRTALQAAAENGRLDMAAILLENSKMSDHGTVKSRCEDAAQFADMEGHATVARFLREWEPIK